MIKSRSWAFHAAIQCSPSFQASSLVMASLPSLSLSPAPLNGLIDWPKARVRKWILHVLPWLATRLLREAVWGRGRPWCDGGPRLCRHRILWGRVPACREFSEAGHRDFSRAVFRCDYRDVLGSRGA